LSVIDHVGLNLGNTSMDSFAMNFAVTLLALGFVLGLAWVALRFLKGRIEATRVPGRGDEGLRFVRALPVGAKERVVIVEHRGERWMLGVSAGGISTIAHWADSSSTSVEAQP
jgi:flagellar protein FliO/FliZ